MNTGNAILGNRQQLKTQMEENIAYVRPINRSVDYTNRLPSFDVKIEISPVISKLISGNDDNV